MCCLELMETAFVLQNTVNSSWSLGLAGDCVSILVCTCDEGKKGGAYTAITFLRFEFFSPSFIHFCHHTERETGGNYALFNFLTFRQDWICSAAKSDKKESEGRVSSQLSLHVAADTVKRRERGRINAMHLFIQTVHLLCGKSLASICITTDTHTHTQSMSESRRERERKRWSHIVRAPVIMGFSERTWQWHGCASRPIILNGLYSTMEVLHGVK